MISTVLLLPVSLLAEGRHLIPALKAAPALMQKHGVLLFGNTVSFMSYLVICSLFYHFYNQTSYQALADLSPLSHPIATQGIVSAAVSVGGTFLYSLAQQYEAKKAVEKKSRVKMKSVMGMEKSLRQVA